MTALTDTFELSNGTKIPKVGFGTWQIPANQAEQAVTDALAVGYRHIDTALAYQNEEAVGKGLKNSGLKREDYFVTTKLPGETKTYDGVLKDIDTSLNNLGLDYVDLYIIHAPWPWGEQGANYDKENKEVWRAMEKLYKDGKAKAIGISNFGVHEMQNILDGAEIKPMLNQIRYFIGNTEPEVTAYAKAQGLLVEAYSPLATGGLLAKPDIVKMAKKYGVSTAQLAIKFCLQNDVLPLPKAVHKEHAENNANLDGFEISPDDLADLNAK